MISVKEAEKIILEKVRSIEETEIIDFNDSFKRILAADISSALDFPYNDNSSMDGYALRYEDVKEANPDNPVILRLIEEIPAGKMPVKRVNRGETARIFTGGILPEGADTIVMQENTIREDDRVSIRQAPGKPGDFVRYRGAFYRAGTPLLTRHTPINSPEMAILATAQCLKVEVFRRPRVSILSTGDELIRPDETLTPAKIIDSNSYALKSFVEDRGCIAVCSGIIGDDRQKLKNTIQNAIYSSDVVISTGGVSVGDYDYVEDILEELQGEILIRSVAIQPGKPLTFAVFPNGCLYFGLPGNPVSSLVCSWRFLSPALKKLSGLKNYLPVFIGAITRDNLKSSGKREVYLWGRVEIVNGNYEFILAPGQHNSANLINLAGTNALALIPIATTNLNPGDRVEVMLV